MDARPIWTTGNFAPPTKSSLYLIECVNVVMRNLIVLPRPMDSSIYQEINEAGGEGKGGFDCQHQNC
jgi:hypothetical protein